MLWLLKFLSHTSSCTHSDKHTRTDIWRYCLMLMLSSVLSVFFPLTAKVIYVLYICSHTTSTTTAQAKTTSRSYGEVRLVSLLYKYKKITTNINQFIPLHQFLQMIIGSWQRVLFIFIVTLCLALVYRLFNWSSHLYWLIA